MCSTCTLCKPKINLLGIKYNQTEPERSILVTDDFDRQAGHQMKIRFPEGTDLRDRLMERAKANNRSLTAEIMWRLEISLDPNAKVLPAEDVHDMIISDLNEKVEAAMYRLDWLDSHFKLDSRPDWMKTKPKQRN